VRRRLRRWLLAAAAGALAAALVLALLAWRQWTTGFTPPAGAAATATVRVVPGQTLGEVAAELAARDLLRHPRLFRLAARLLGRDRALHVGRYEVPRGAAPREILRRLTEHPPLPVVVTLPEGREAAEMAAVLADSLGLEAADILAVADSLVRGGADTLMTGAERARLVRVLGGPGRPGAAPLHWCEGYLAPDTYHFAEGVTAPAVAAAVVELQLARLDTVRRAALAPARGLSPHGLLTLASLVETEARLAPERPRIAAVYHNRLARGMRLEADPTVAFWLGKRGERLLFRDLAVDSPYNTYQRAGLPAGPIGAPGRAALRAAARPDTATAALYFVADGEGGHVFSRTHAEHQRAVARYRELMRERRR
jgi:UPF0755 protein